MTQVADRQVDSPPPTHDEVRAFLRKLLASPDFGASERNRRFLSYVVEETLSGRGNRIKAYSVALAAFDRGKDFDPLSDPIVRIEAGRLRRALEHYYLTGGRFDPIRIDIPKGSYVAAFNRVALDGEVTAEDQSDQIAADGTEPPLEPKASAARAAGPEISPPPAPPAPTAQGVGKRTLALAAAVLIVAVGIWITIQQVWNSGRAGDALPRGPKIIVYPFEEISDNPGQSFVSRGMTYDIIASLTRFNDLFVYGPDTSFYVGAHQQARTNPVIQADFALTGSVFSVNGAVRVSAMLADVRTGRNVWSWSNEAPLTPSDIRETQTEIAEHVARAVAQPYGTLFEQSATEIAGKPASDLLSYECVVRFQQYWRTYDANMYEELVACMQATIARDPEYARAYSCLALLYVDAHRFDHRAADLPPDPVQRALELANAAINMEPMASDGYLALSVARWFNHDVEGGLAAARQGLALNPNNTILIGELSIRYALLARWEESKAMADKLFALNPRAPAGYRRSSFIYAYMQGDYEAALTELLAAETPLNLHDYVFRAMTYAQLGDSQKAKAAVSQILALDPKYGERVAADFRKRNADPSIVRAIVDGLAKAGLAVSLPTGIN
jgi:TolB-like protein